MGGGDKLRCRSEGYHNPPPSSCRRAPVLPVGSLKATGARSYSSIHAANASDTAVMHGRKGVAKLPVPASELSLAVLNGAPCKRCSPQPRVKVPGMNRTTRPKVMLPVRPFRFTC